MVTLPKRENRHNYRRVFVIVLLCVLVVATLLFIVPPTVFMDKVDRSIIKLTDEDIFVRENAALTLGELGDERGIEPLVAALNDEDSLVRYEAKRALKRLGQEENYKVEFLTSDLKYSAFSDNREKAILGLVETGDKRAVEALIVALDDSSWVVREEAIKALGRLGDPRAVEPLIASLKDNEKWVRGEAAKTLGKLADTSAVEPLIAALSDVEGHVRGEAAEALGMSGDKRAVNPLIKTLLDDDAHRDAENALEKLNQEGKIDETAVEPLITVLNEIDDNNQPPGVCLGRTAACRLLVEVSKTRALEPCITAIKDKCSSLRAAAAEGLGKIGDKRAVEPLIEALDDESGFVRKHVAEALYGFKDKRAVEPLIKCLRDENAWVQGHAARALGEIGDKRAIPELRRLYRSTQPWEIAQREGYEQLKRVKAKLRAAGVRDIYPSEGSLGVELKARGTGFAHSAAKVALSKLGERPADRRIR